MAARGRMQCEEGQRATIPREYVCRGLFVTDTGPEIRDVFAKYVTNDGKVFQVLVDDHDRCCGTIDDVLEPRAFLFVNWRK